MRLLLQSTENTLEVSFRSNLSCHSVRFPPSSSVTLPFHPKHSYLSHVCSTLGLRVLCCFSHSARVNVYARSLISFFRPHSFFILPCSMFYLPSSLFVWTSSGLPYVFSLLSSVLLLGPADILFVDTSFLLPSSSQRSIASDHCA